MYSHCPISRFNNPTEPHEPPSGQSLDSILGGICQKNHRSPSGATAGGADIRVEPVDIATVSVCTQTLDGSITMYRDM